MSPGGYTLSAPARLGNAEVPASLCGGLTWGIHLSPDAQGNIFDLS
ncbi:hypothetical protein [Methylosarcina fibrata]|nr:hypothetical protein [Methylosarcina fibrata]